MKKFGYAVPTTQEEHQRISEIDGCLKESGLPLTTSRQQRQ